MATEHFPIDLVITKWLQSVIACGINEYLYKSHKFLLYVLKPCNLGVSVDTW